MKVVHVGNCVLVALQACEDKRHPHQMLGQVLAHIALDVHQVVVNLGVCWYMSLKCRTSFEY